MAGGGGSFCLRYYDALRTKIDVCDSPLYIHNLKQIQLIICIFDLCDLIFYYSRIYLRMDEVSLGPRKYIISVSETTSYLRLLVRRGRN